MKKNFNVFFGQKIKKNTSLILDKSVILKKARWI